MASTRSRKALEPSGRPVVSDLRNASDSWASSPDRSSAAKSGTRSRTGALCVRPSPRRLEQQVHARPSPVLRALDKTRAHRVQGSIAQGGEQMRLVHCHAAKASLPEMPRAFLARMDASGIGAIHFRKCRAQGIGMIGNEHQMDMIGHQHPTPHRHAMRCAIDRQQIAIGGMDLGIRYEEGRGVVVVDIRRTKRLYALAASDSGGTIWVYSPPVGNGTKRLVILINHGSPQSGLPEVARRLSVLEKAE